MAVDPSTLEVASPEPAAAPAAAPPPAPAPTDPLEAIRAARATATAQANEEARQAEAAAAAPPAAAPEGTATTEGGETPPPGEPAGGQSPAPEPAEGDDKRPLTRSERGELHALRTRVSQLEQESKSLKAGGDAKAGTEPPTAPPPPVLDQAAALGEARKMAGLDPDIEGGATYETLVTMRDNLDQAGLAALKRADGEEGGYTLEEARDEIKRMERVHRSLGGINSYYETNAYGSLATELDELAVSAGLDPADVSAKAQAARDKGGKALTAFVSTLLDAARADGAKEWKGKHDALAARTKGDIVGDIASRDAPERGGTPGTSGSLAVLQQARNDPAKRRQFIEDAKNGVYANIDTSSVRV